MEKEQNSKTEENINKKTKSSEVPKNNKESKELITKPGYRWQYDIVILGYKCYMIDILACLCLSQLKKLEKNLERRRYIQEKYNKEVKSYIELKAWTKATSPSFEQLEVY